MYVARLRIYWLRTRFGLAAAANQARPGLSDAEIAAAADYAWMVAQSHRERLREIEADFQGQAILELGPGANFGVVLALADLVGAGRVVVCDRFLTGWDEDYHPRVYRRLAEIMARAGYSPDRVRIAAESGHGIVVEHHAVGIEALAVPADTFALTISQAVLEHVEDHAAAFRNLYRITAPGGAGSHQVDFRDHRDFSRPLRLATLGEARFRRLFAASHGECGTRLRPVEMASLIRRSGFQPVMVPTDQARPDQVVEALARIDPGRGLSEEDVLTIGAVFILRK